MNTLGFTMTSLCIFFIFLYLDAINLMVPDQGNTVSMPKDMAANINNIIPASQHIVLSRPVFSINQAPINRTDAEPYRQPGISGLLLHGNRKNLFSA